MKTFKDMDILTFSKQLESRMKERLDEFNADQDEILKVGHAESVSLSVSKEVKNNKTNFDTNGQENVRF